MFIIFIFAFKLAARQPLGNWSVTVGVEWACQPVLLVSCRHRTLRRGESASRLGSLSGSVCISCCVFSVLSFSCCCCGYYKAWHCVVCCWQVGNFKVCRAVPLATIGNCMENVKWTEKNCDFSDYQFRPLFSSFFWVVFPKDY